MVSHDRRGGLVSVVIPAHDEAPIIARTVSSALQQQVPDTVIEVIVSDDGSTDETRERARAAGARVIARSAEVSAGNPGAARNRGAAAAKGDPIVFLDADCVPAPGWLAALLSAHDEGETIVGGALDIPRGLPAMARCDHYCGSYHLHPRRRPGVVSNHTPANLSVRATVFRDTDGFAVGHPMADGHEELPWQAAAQRAGHRIWFEPAAVAHHHNRPGFANLLRRNYRWGYSSLESKASTGVGRLPWLYRRPRLLIAAGPPLALVHTVYTLGCWARAGVLEPIAMAPAVLMARVAYAAGFMVGGTRWLARRNGASRTERPRWR